jgi:Leucine-rich repeat (LRR) protein
MADPSRHQTSFSRSALILFFVTATLCSRAQLISYEFLDTCRIYRSLSEAMKNPDQVYRLHLEKQKLDSIPQVVLAFRNLNELNLNKNKLKELPSFIGRLKYLQILMAEHNRIDTLNKELFWLQHLKELRLGDNNIEYIPPSIKKLPELKILSLWDNPVDAYPAELGELKELTVLDILNNQIGYRELEKLQTILAKQTRIIHSPPCKCDDEDQ